VQNEKREEAAILEETLIDRKREGERERERERGKGSSVGRRRLLGATERDKKRGGDED
jgi:hypothetical protein